VTRRIIDSEGDLGRKEAGQITAKNGRKAQDVDDCYVGGGNVTEVIQVKSGSR